MLQLCPGIHDLTATVPSFRLQFGLAVRGHGVSRGATGITETGD